MKMSHFILRTQGVCRNASKNLFSSSSASTVIIERNKTNPPYRSTTFPKTYESSSSLHRRISPVGDPNISIEPVLDQWVRERREVDKESLVHIIKFLKRFRRFKHALEISEWMTNKRYIPPTMGDTACRLHLIYKVHGLKKSEEFYNNISQIFKGYEVDVTLLNIYSLSKSVDKAEALMQKLRDTGHHLTLLPYNILLNLYYSIENWEKMDELTDEMDKKGIYGSKYSFTTLLRSYAARNNTEGLNMTMAKMEADPHVDIDCTTYFIAADAFLKAGLVEKGLKILKTTEEKAITDGKFMALNPVLTTYARLGKKEDLWRIWKIIKEKSRDNVYNAGYRSMIKSLLKFDDIEGAERIFEEWETKGYRLSYDFRVLDCLIDAYVRKGDLVKAEGLFKRGIEKGAAPTCRTWYRLGIGYIEDDQILKGVEALRNATLSGQFLPLYKHVEDKLVILLEYLERRRNVEEVEAFMDSLAAEGVFSSAVCRRLADFIMKETSES